MIVLKDRMRLKFACLTVLVFSNIAILLVPSGNAEAVFLSQAKPRLVENDVPVKDVLARHQITVFYRYNGMYDGENEPFVMIFEVRNSEGITEYLAWQGGTTGDSITSRHVGFFWAPERAGEYELRAIAITSFENPEVLTYVWPEKVLVH